MEVYTVGLAKIRVPGDLLLRLFMDHMEDVIPSPFSYETALLQVSADETNSVIFLVESSAHDKHVPGTPIPEIEWKKED